jgi:hypothetical protein
MKEGNPGARWLTHILRRCGSVMSLEFFNEQMVSYNTATRFPGYQPYYLRNNVSDV